MTVIEPLRRYFLKPVHLAPLAVFRVAFGLLMLFSLLRFMSKGWVYDLYIRPKLFFPYYGFEWIQPLDGMGMYLVFVCMAVCALFIALGFFYRISTLLFFLTFTYVELIDKTNYLNHYYFISIVSFLLIFLPSHRYFSIDVWRNNKLAATNAPNYFIFVIKLQVFIVYFFAGIAKINSDWLLHAMPLKIWLPAHDEMPVIGALLSKNWVAYLFSWFACLYDLLIPFFLFLPYFIRPVYFLVIVFHLATSLFFKIGMFPYIMICLTTIFFSENFHIRIIDRMRAFFGYKIQGREIYLNPSGRSTKVLALLCVLHFGVQIFLPFRYLLYPGRLFWTEQGYRFSWRVMLMEKAGTAFFFVHDHNSGRQSEVDNAVYLTPMQEKMMATQPDMMVDYAKFLKKEFTKLGFQNPKVTAQSFVTLNGSGSREFIDPTVDLSQETNAFLKNKAWVKSY